jgi:predicted metalloprotease with PDZ domain
MRILPALLLIGLLFALEARAMDEYVVRVPDVRARLVYVEAEVDFTGEDLLMSPFGAEHLEFGWAEFVQDARAFSADGSPLLLDRLPGGAFRCASDGGLRIRMEYTVNITHDLAHWPFGSDEAACVQDAMMMVTGNAIFITRLDLDSARVRIELPAGQAVASAWQQIGEGEFMVVGAEELVWTVLLLGEFHQHSIEAGDIRVVQTYGAKLAPSAAQLARITREAVAGYMGYFGGAPRTSVDGPTTFLMVLNVDTTFEGGGATFTNSMSILFAEAPSACGTLSSHCWHHIVVHELGHLWMGYSVLTEESDQWIREGFTDHLAFRLQRDIGLFSEEQWQVFLQEKEREAEDVRARSTVPLAATGGDKAANYDLIYSGGFQFAQRLDEHLRASTQGSRDLHDVMNALYAAYAGTGRPVGRNELLQLSTNVCDCDLRKLFGDMLDR